MQSDHNEVYKLTSIRTGKPESLYKDIGNFVFKELNSFFTTPKSLIVKLKGVGFWYLRKKRMDASLSNLLEEGKTREDFRKQQGFDNYCEGLRMQKIFQERMPEYEEYLKINKELKRKRYGLEIPLESTDGEDKSLKSSPTEPTQHMGSGTELDKDTSSDPPAHQGAD